jgi:hypothetical protein
VPSIEEEKEKMLNISVCDYFQLVNSKIKNLRVNNTRKVQCTFLFFLKKILTTEPARAKKMKAILSTCYGHKANMITSQTI